MALSVNTLVAGTPFYEATFEDAYGNEVNVAVSGTTGTAAFYDEFGNLGVEDGENIGSVYISGASSNFTLTYSVVDYNDLDDNTIKMGNIYANSASGQSGNIRGVYSVGSGDYQFELYSYRGVDFSSGGGLSTDVLSGGLPFSFTDDDGLNAFFGGGGGIGIQLKTMNAGTTIAVRDYVGSVFNGVVATVDTQFYGAPVDIFLGSSASSSVAGSLLLGDVVDNEDNVGANIQVGKTTNSFLLQASGVDQDFLFTSLARFNGDITISGDGVNPSLVFNGGVGSASQITGFFDGVLSNGSFAGELNELGDLDLVVNGNVEKTARITSGGEEGNLAVSNGSILKGALIDAAGVLFAAVGGNVGGSITGDAVYLRVLGSVSGATLNGRDYLDVTVDRGTITKSSLYGGRGLLEAEADDGPVGINVRTIASDITSTLFNAAANIVVYAGRDATGNTFITDDALDLTVVRNFKGSSQAAGLTELTVLNGSVQSGSRFTDSSEVNITVVRGGFTGVITTDSLELSVAGNVGSGSVINTLSIVDVDEEEFDNLTNFFVGGSFAGLLNVNFWDVYGGDGDDLSLLVIGGGVTKAGRITVGQFVEAGLDETVVFGGNYSGLLTHRLTLEQSLSFLGNVNQITIGGQVGPQDGGDPVSIYVQGKLTQLTSNSYFYANSPFGGSFRPSPGAGVGATTGTLFALGGYKRVLPVTPFI